ncbi:hypothetical protein K439DRAFT_1408619 [Ramaria rubella]|nr:hypothetical protein K439DRAFT_1408619 [Ramaria rubella]
MADPVAPGGKEFDPFEPPPKSTGDLRMWRHDQNGNLWIKGGRGRCIGRFCCCTIMIAILLLVSIVLTLAIFLRPPDIQFNGVSPSTSGSSVQATNNDLKVNLGIGISVRNPNFFSVAFKSITANLTYPINNTAIGGGEESNVVFPSNSLTTFTFPFTIEYSQASDPQGAILTDIATKCGFLPGAAKQQLSVGYDLKLAIRILFVTIAPPISGTFNFDCPFTLDDIKANIYCSSRTAINSFHFLQPLISGISGLSGLGGAL